MMMVLVLLLMMLLWLLLRLRLRAHPLIALGDLSRLAHPAVPKRPLALVILPNIILRRCSLRIPRVRSGQRSGLRISQLMQLHRPDDGAEFLC